MQVHNAKMTTIASSPPTASPRKQAHATPWDWLAYSVALLVLLPLISLGVTALWTSGTAVPWAILTRASLETFQLSLGVLVCSALIGISTGWLIAIYQFPGRNLLGWLLILPFAVPTYISAYAYVEAMDYFGPLQGFVRQIFGYQSRADYWFPEMRSTSGAIFVNSIVLYPYIYVASRAAFTMQGGLLINAARMLGCTRLEAFRRVVLPAVWPAIAAGGTLVLLETLNDIGASQYLGVETFTVAIFNTWLNRGSLAGAAQLALMVFVIVVAILWFERWLRNNRRFMQSNRNNRVMNNAQLSGWRALVAIIICALPVLAGFCLPALILIKAAFREFVANGLSSEIFWAARNSLVVSSLATATILLLAFTIASAHRFTKLTSTHSAVRLSTIGYALPGTVLVIGLLPALGLADGFINSIIKSIAGGQPGLILSGSLIAVVVAYVIRFMAIGIEQLQAGLGSISRNTDFAAHSLGCPQSKLAWKIHLPAIRPALAGAAILVFVDCLKELPATLLLRPLNFETLATSLYGHAARGSFEDGALAALMIVLAGLLPLIAMHRLMERE
jgi:iron(III) transport system permease protein